MNFSFFKHKYCLLAKIDIERKAEARTLIIGFCSKRWWRKTSKRHSKVVQDFVGDEQGGEVPIVLDRQSLVRLTNRNTNR